MTTCKEGGQHVWGDGREGKGRVEVMDGIGFAWEGGFN